MTNQIFQVQENDNIKKEFLNKPSNERCDKNTSTINDGNIEPDQN